MQLSHDETMIDINYQLRLIQKRDGLTFGSDAFLLASYVRRLGARRLCACRSYGARRQPGVRAADLGSGTGIIPLLLLSRQKAASCDAIEVQPDFAELITRNAELNGYADTLHAHCADVRDLRPEPLGGMVDFVVSNPPYMKDSGHRSISDRRQIARHEQHGGIDDFCAAAFRLLKHGGLFYTVWRPDRLCDLLTSLHAARLEPKRVTFVHARAELPPCLVLCESKKGAAPGMYVTPTLTMFTHDTVMTETLNRIYETGEFDEPYQRP